MTERQVDDKHSKTGPLMARPNRADLGSGDQSTELHVVGFVDTRFVEFLRQEQEDRETIRVKRLYIEVAGDVASGVLLSNLVYWCQEDRFGKTRLRVLKHGHYWIARTAEHLFEECGLTKKQAARCLGQLEAMGIIVTEIFKFNGAPTKHFRVIPDRFMEEVDAARNRIDARRGDGSRITRPVLVRQTEPVVEGGKSPKGKVTKGHPGKSPKVTIDSDQRELSIVTDGHSPVTASTTTATTASTTTLPLTPQKESISPSGNGEPRPSVSEAEETTLTPLPPAPVPMVRADAEDRIHQTATSRSARNFREAQPVSVSKGWSHQDIQRMRSIISTGLDDGKVVVEGGYPTDMTGMRPSQGDINLIFTIVPRSRGSDFLKAVFGYADCARKTDRSIRRLANWLKPNKPANGTVVDADETPELEWERWINWKPAPTKAPLRNVSQRTNDESSDTVSPTVHANTMAKVGDYNATPVAWLEEQERKRQASAS